MYCETCKAERDALEMFNGSFLCTSCHGELTCIPKQFKTTLPAKERFVLSERLFFRWLEDAKTGADGNPADLERAVALCREAALDGYPPAILKMGYYYDKDCLDTGKSEKVRSRIADSYYSAIEATEYAALKQKDRDATLAESEWEALKNRARTLSEEMHAQMTGRKSFGDGGDLPRQLLKFVTDGGSPFFGLFRVTYPNLSAMLAVDPEDKFLYLSDEMNELRAKSGQMGLWLLKNDSVARPLFQAGPKSPPFPLESPGREDTYFIFFVQSGSKFTFFNERQKSRIKQAIQPKSDGDDFTRDLRNRVQGTSLKELVFFEADIRGCLEKDAPNVSGGKLKAALAKLLSMIQE